MKNITIQLSFLSILFLGIQACGQIVEPEENTSQAEVDTTITKENSFSDLFLDSANVEGYIRSHSLESERARQLREFYQSRNYQFAWFSDGQPAQQTYAFWSLHNRHLNYSKDSSFYNRQLHEQMRELLNEDEDVTMPPAQFMQLELELTDHFFDYAQYAYTGKIDPEDIKWHIPRKKVNAIRLLDSLVQKNGKGLDNWEPVNEQYRLLREKLVRLYEIEKQGGWSQIITSDVYRRGDSSAAVPLIRQRLYLSGDIQNADNSPIFTEALETALKKAQKRFGLEQDGVAGPMTIAQLNIPVEERIEQLLVNMERMRWLPLQKGGTRLVANIPEFRLHVYENGKEIFQMKIVVGKAANRSVIFSDELQYVVFSPYWNIPRSIVRNEILPAMKNNTAYLSRHNMEQTGTRNGLPVIRQKPGAGNALGRVKFIFPNSYNIYFHDTPAKSLFDEQSRAFSHGCIRLEQPKRLAEYLLRNNNEWDEGKIKKAMHANKERWVKLGEPVDVVISYFTAWVDDEGSLNFRNDIYGHDKKLKERLFD